MLSKPGADRAQLGNPFETAKGFLDDVFVKVKGKHLARGQGTGAENTRVAIELFGRRQLCWQQATFRVISYSN